MGSVIRIVAGMAAVAFLSALALRDLSIVQFSDAYLLPCTAVVVTLAYAAQAAKAWRIMRDRPGFRKVRWLMLAVSGPALMFFVPLLVFVLLLMAQVPLDAILWATFSVVLAGGALVIFNMVSWHKQAGMTRN